MEAPFALPATTIMEWLDEVSAAGEQQVFRPAAEHCVDISSYYATSARVARARPGLKGAWNAVPVLLAFVLGRWKGTASTIDQFQSFQSPRHPAARTVDIE